MTPQLHPIRRPIQISPLINNEPINPLLVRLLARLLRRAHDPQIPKLISTGHGLVVEHASRGRPARDRVVREGDHAVRGGLVDDVGGCFADVGTDDAVALGLEGGDLVRDDGAAGFAEEGAEAEVVDEEFVADAEGEAAVEG